ncbi:MAG: diguanylate cyclase [Candidatus Moranbacteria bacterium]|nr:diguanylate cyclase [Candidatus Moranbacteria bacterium]
MIQLRSIIKPADNCGAKSVQVVHIYKGHFHKKGTIGDTVLETYANIMRSNVPGSDYLARIGGDEFAIILPEVTDKENVIMVARKIINKLIMPYTILNTEKVIGTSIGIASYPKDADNMDSLLQKADKAMFRAKSHGKNNYKFYNDSYTI